MGFLGEVSKGAQVCAQGGAGGVGGQILPCWAPKASRPRYGRKHRAWWETGGSASSNQRPEEEKSEGCSPWSARVLGFGWGRREELDCCSNTESLLGVSILRLLRKGVGASPLVLQLELRSRALRQALPSPNSLMICLLVQIREPASGEM